MLRVQTDSLPQRLLITLFADYRSVIDGPVPSRLLVDMLQEFDVAHEASRTALARLTHQGLLLRQKNGRSTSYELSGVGQQFVLEDQKRIFEFGSRRPWDGLWTMVLFAVGEEKRSRRYAIKSRLNALGFAPLYDGAWVAAFATPESAQEALTQENIVDFDVFRASFIGLPNRIDALHAKWKVADLHEDYLDFIRSFGPVSENGGSSGLSPAGAFVARTRLMDAWRAFPAREPDLPAEFLPEGWPLPRAREIFTTAYETLRPASEARVLRLLSEG